LSITIDGYSDKSKALFEDLLKALKQFKPREQKFKTYKELLLRNYQNDSLEMPLMQGFETLQSILHKDFFTGKEKAAAIKKITFDQFQDFIHRLFEKTYVEGMMYGNMDLEEAQSVTAFLMDTLASQPYPKDEQKKVEIIVLPKDQGPFYIETKSKVQGNAAILVIGMDPFSFKERAAQQILMQAIKEPFFSTLRTKQQTGYIVFSKAEELEKHLFDIFSVQSNTHEGRDLLARFELFIEGFLQELSKSEVPEESFDNIKNAQLTNLRQPPQSITEMSALLYKLAFSYNGDFKWREKRINAMEQLSYEEFLKSTYQVLGKENKRRIAIIFTGATEDNLKYRRLNGTPQLKNISTYEAALQENEHE
ncbi:MAG TPA: insulinase family protein, partial [Parachlamydiaceae bacterium]|nr:insulinase family protein [Parachlamydiaceae bacterium]